MRVIQIILWILVLFIFAWGIFTSEPDPEADTMHAYP